MRMLGLFFTKDQRMLRGISDAPYHRMGRHALCAENCATDGGAIACAVGRMRNAGAIRDQLLSEGIAVKESYTFSDLVLSAYRLWGVDYPAHLEGVISTAVIDQDSGLLVLSRDRMGELPLFYAYRGSAVAFCDHPSPLLKSTLADPIVDREGWCEVFGLGPARTPAWTPYRDIYALDAGCALVADERGHRVHRYFALEARPHEDDEKRTIETVRALVDQAMRDVLPLDPGSMLSGGLDSTVLTGLLTKMTGRRARTYSVDYEENQRFFGDNSYQPERDAPYIEQASELFGTDHLAITLPVDQLYYGLDDAMALRGLPGMADIDSSLMLFARQIARHEQYVLSGECGDEVFGGYPWFRREELIYSDIFPWSGSLALREKILRPTVREKLNLAQHVAAHYHASVATLPVLAGEPPRDAKLRQVHGLCFRWFMPNLQERAQRMCEAAGLTVLTPYCDDRLVQYVYNIPWDMKIQDGLEKSVLRKAMADLMPDSLLNRKKSPYPKTYHPTYTKLVCEAMMNVLNDKTAPILELIDAQNVREIIEGPLSPTETPWFGQLMSGPQMLAYLLQVNRWMKKYGVEVGL